MPGWPVPNGWRGRGDLPVGLGNHDQSDYNQADLRPRDPVAVVEALRHDRNPAASPHLALYQPQIVGSSAG
jgi:hypothetical protein